MTDCQPMEFMTRLGQNVLRQGIPLNGTFELTARCNFRCRMCYVRLEEAQIAQMGEPLSVEQWLALAKQARDLGMLHLTLTGGEIFTYPGFRQLYEQLCDLGLLITLQTNGYAIDENVMQWLGKCQPFMIRLTLYGASNETYGALCGVRDGFDRVNKAIDLIHSAGIPLSAVTTLTRENVEDLPRMQQLAARKGFPLGQTSLLMPAVRGATSQSRQCSLDLPAAIRSVGSAVPKRKSDRPMLWDCGSYRNGFYITWNGKLQLCTFMDTQAVDAFPFAQKWGELLAKLEQYQEPAQCRNCQYKLFCLRCPGRLAAWQLPDGRIDPAFCDIARAGYEAWTASTRKENPNEEEI